MSAQSTSTMLPEQEGVEYRETVGFIGYVIGDNGNVWSRRRCGAGGLGEYRQLKPVLMNNGYLCVNLRYPNGRRAPVTVHTLVLAAFVGPCPPGMECRHLDGCRTNNHVANLRWGTPKENATDRKRHGTARYNPLRGLAHPRATAKLTDDDVRAIVSMMLDGVKQRDIATLYGVVEGAICDIRNGRHWAHIVTDAERERLVCRETKCGRGKLTPEDVRTIRRRITAGERHKDIAIDYGVNKSLVSNIGRRFVWSHVED